MVLVISFLPNVRPQSNVQTTFLTRHKYALLAMRPSTSRMFY